MNFGGKKLTQNGPLEKFRRKELSRTEPKIAKSRKLENRENGENWKIGKSRNRKFPFFSVGKMEKNFF